MARKLRLEFPGAIYHVINRGNYRAYVFKTPGARQAFEECLFAAWASQRGHALSFTSLTLVGESPDWPAWRAS